MINVSRNIFSDEEGFKYQNHYQSLVNDLIKKSNFRNFNNNKKKRNIKTNKKSVEKKSAKKG